jgi:HK97 gp10 family phage protein
VVRVINREAVDVQLKWLTDRGSAEAQQAVAELGMTLFAAGDLIQTSAQESITTGAISGKGHVPSLPGEPPKADTHTLDRQIETEMVEPLRIRVTSYAPYSAALEFGTSRMAARPFMMPAAARERKAAVKMVRDAVTRIVERNRK